MLRNHEVLSSSSCAPQDFQGVSELLMRRSMSFSGMEGPAEEVHGEDDNMSEDEGSQMMGLGEKKRRLNLEQLKALEKSFELGNKLEPERKMQLARALGLQPRQIAIWFQNRRARWKTKQLEKDYDVLKRQFEALKADNDALKSQNNKLQTQLMALKSRETSGGGAINLNKKDSEGRSWSNGSESSNCDHLVNLNTNNTATAAASIESTLVYHQGGNNNNKNAAALVYPSSINGPAAPSNFTQILHMSTSSTPDDDHHHHYHHLPPSNNQGICNMLGGIEEKYPEFWPWPEQQNFH